MKTWQTEHIFNHPFSTLTRAVWRKYPNPLKPEVIGSDVTERYIKDDGSLETHRVMETKFGLPGWSRKLLGSDTTCYGYEKSLLDVNKQFMSQVSRNITFARTVTLGEKLTYSAHGDNQTKLVQESTVEVHGLPFSGYLEDTILLSITSNTFKGRDAMEWVVARINEEDVLGIEPDHNNGLGPKLYTKLEKSDTDADDLVSITSLPNSQIDLAVAGDVTEFIIKPGTTALKPVKSFDKFIPNTRAALAVVDDISQSVENLGAKALKSIDGLSEKAFLPDSRVALAVVDDITESFDNIGAKAVQSIRSIDDFSEKALKSIKSMENLNVDNIGDKAIQSIKCMDDNLCEAVEDISTMAFKLVNGSARYISDTWSPHALRSYEIFDDFFNIS